MKLTAFLDTGSQCKLLKSSIAETLPIKQSECSLCITGICGGVKFIESCLETDIFIDDVKLRLKFYIVDDDLIEEDMLIGQGAFTDTNVRCVATNGRFNFEVGEIRSPITDLETGEIELVQKSALISFINRYRDVFAIDVSEIGKTSLVELAIELDTKTPKGQAPYRIPGPKKRVVSEIVNELLKNDIISKSESDNIGEEKRW